jgi:predicted HNH restriction endonuclease
MEERLCKIVWNDKDWIQPIKRKWDPSKDEKEGWEHAHGFIWEDWLFDEKFQFDGYQYGHIEGVNKVRKDIDRIDVLHLFTIHPDTKERLYIGRINNIERLQRAPIDSSVLNKIKKLHPYLISKVKGVGANYRKLKDVPFIPSFRFKLEDKVILPFPIAINDALFSNQSYGRTQPFIVDRELKKVINRLENDQVLITSLEQLQSNIALVESYLLGTEEEMQFVIELIRLGSCFVCYQINNHIGFAPSRFLGYVNNNLEKHNKSKKDHKVDGRETNPVITKILKQSLAENKILEKKYCEYCKIFGVSPAKKKRTFWKINLPEDFNGDLEVSGEFSEGNIVERIHKSRERDARVVQIAKNNFKKKHGRLFCEICNFDFEKKYGEIGADFIEGHHKLALSKMASTHKTKPEDIAMLCSNCHRMVHKRNNWLTIDEMRKLLK